MAATPSQLELTAVYLGERHRFANADGDVVVADCRIVGVAFGERPPEINGAKIVTFRGEASDGELKFNATYRFFGKWSSYTNRRTGISETQFHFSSFTEAAPVERSGVVAYLQKYGEGCGIGKARAEKLFSEYGTDAVRVAREQPETVVASIAGVTLDGAQLLSQRLTANYHAEAANIELVELFARRGLPKATARRAMELWGTAAAKVVRHDPYKLMRFRGCGFKKTDQMYLSLGLPPGRLKRQALCAWHAIAKATQDSGDTWTAASVAVTAIGRNIAGADPRPAEAIRLAVRAGILDTLRTDGIRGPFVDRAGQLWLSETNKARNERFIARHLADAANELPAWPDIPSVGVSDHQHGALCLSTAGVIGILGGSPGTGKTFSAAAIIQAIIAEHGIDQVAACAPTGKAAVRLTEALAGYGIDLRARTIHSTLGIDPMASKGDGWRFIHNERNPLKIRFLIVDEASMIDADLFAALLAARAKGTHVLIIGDVNQLLPVGHGAPLRDMIAAGLPYGELTEIRRNSGMIVEACAKMRDGEFFDVADNSVEIDDGRNLALCRCSDSQQQIRTMQHTINRVREGAFGEFDPVWDVQILAAVNAKSPLSRRELNKILQAELNTNPGSPNCPFRVGDKIVNTKNGYYNDADGGRDSDTGEFTEHYVANGEIGRVLAIEEKSFIVALDTPERTVRVPRGKYDADADGEPTSDERGGVDNDKDDDRAPQTGCAWDLAYALSVHKSQGSEFPVVIVMLDDYPGAKRVCDRAWLYTATSRAKKLCVLIGQEATARRMVRINRIMERKTFLRELFERERVKDLVESL